MNGRKAGFAEGYAYSSAMRDSDVIWGTESLNDHLLNVATFISGNRMGSLFPAGVQDSEERANVVAYILAESSQ